MHPAPQHQTPADRRVNAATVLTYHADTLGLVLTPAQLHDAVDRADAVDMVLMHGDDQSIVARGIVATVAAEPHTILGHMVDVR